MVDDVGLVVAPRVLRGRNGDGAVGEEEVDEEGGGPGASPADGREGGAVSAGGHGVLRLAGGRALEGGGGEGEADTVPYSGGAGLGGASGGARGHTSGGQGGGGGGGRAGAGRGRGRGASTGGSACTGACGTGGA